MKGNQIEKLITLCLCTTILLSISACGAEERKNVQMTESVISKQNGEISNAIDDTEGALIVKDSDGKVCNLVELKWAQKYPFAIENLRKELEEKTIILEPYSLYVCVDGNIVPKGREVSLTKNKDDTFSFSVLNAAYLDESEAEEIFSTEKLGQVYEVFGKPQENDTYFAVTVKYENLTDSEFDIYWNGVRLGVLVENELAKVDFCGEAFTSTSNQEHDNPHDGSMYTLGPNESVELTLLYYADPRIDLDDVYVSGNSGIGMGYIKYANADPVEELKGLWLRVTD